MADVNAIVKDASLFFKAFCIFQFEEFEALPRVLQNSNNCATKIRMGTRSPTAVDYDENLFRPYLTPRFFQNITAVMTESSVHAHRRGASLAEYNMLLLFYETYIALAHSPRCTPPAGGAGHVFPIKPSRAFLSRILKAMSVNIHASTLTNIKEHYEQHVVQVFKAVFSNDLEHSLLLHGMNKHALLRLCSDAFYWKGVWLVPTAPVPLTPPDLLPHALYDRLHMLRQYLRPNDAQIGGVTVARYLERDPAAFLLGMFRCQQIVECFPLIAMKNVIPLMTDAIPNYVPFDTVDIHELFRNQSHPPVYVSTTTVKENVDQYKHGVWMGILDVNWLNAQFPGFSFDHAVQCDGITAAFRYKLNGLVGRSSAQKAAVAAGVAPPLPLAPIQPIQYLSRLAPATIALLANDVNQNNMNVVSADPGWI